MKEETIRQIVRRVQEDFMGWQAQVLIHQEVCDYILSEILRRSGTELGPSDKEVLQMLNEANSVLQPVAYYAPRPFEEGRPKDYANYVSRLHELGKKLCERLDNYEIDDDIRKYARRVLNAKLEGENISFGAVGGVSHIIEFLYTKILSSESFIQLQEQRNEAFAIFQEMSTFTLDPPDKNTTLH